MQTGETPDSAFSYDGDCDSPRPEYARVLEKRYRELTDNQQNILRRRICDGATLDRVGADNELTPERVRQIEARALDDLAGKSRKNIEDFGAVGLLLETNDAADDERVREAVAELGQLELPVTESRFVEAGFEPLDRPTTRLLLAMAKRMGVFGGKKARVMRHGGRQWLVAGDRTPERLVAELTEAARDTGVVGDLVEFWEGIEVNLRAHVGSDNEAVDLAHDVVDGLGLEEIGGQYAVLGGVGVVEGLVRILRANDAPMKRDILVEYFPDRSPSTVANALIGPQFVRVGPEEFGLKESGATARPTLRDLVYTEIDGHEQVAVAHLQDVAEKYGYSRASIARYSALPGVIEDAGVLRRRRGDDPPAVPEPGLDYACFRVVAGPYRGRWSCILRVNHDRIYRGSQSIPTPLAELLEIEPGSRRVPVTVGNTKIHATWLQSPYLFGGELRPVLDDLGFIDGDLVRFIVVGPGRLHIAPMPPNTSPDNPYRTLVTGAGLYDEAGQPIADGELGAALAFAVGLPTDAPLHVVERRLGSRHNRALRDAFKRIYPEVFDQ